MKVRLYRGPFDGKVVEHRGGPLIMQGTKKMTRKQQHEWLSSAPPFSAPPYVRAIYQPVYLSINGVTMPATHPDGSVFYEWDSPRRVRSR